MCLHKEIREFILPITGKNYTCIHIPSRENIVFIYRHRKNVLYISHLRKKYYFYPITENDHNYSYPITGKYSIHMPSQENVQIHNPSRDIFIFMSHTGNCSCSYPITGKVKHHKTANIIFCIMNV